MLLKNNGINKLVLVVNKMDDPTVQWDKARWVMRRVAERARGNTSFVLFLHQHLCIRCERVAPEDVASARIFRNHADHP